MLRGAICADGANRHVARRVADSDPVCLPESGSGFQTSLDPDPVSAQILEQKIKSAERSLKVIYQKKT